jgi:hypothetical protein
MSIPGILGVPRRNRNRAVANRALLLPQPHARPAAVLGDELDALAKIALELAGS